MNAEFFEISAQVIPTIFIAVVLELRNIVGHTATRWEVAFAEQREERKWYGRYATSAISMIVAASVFVLGELTALSVVFFGTEGPWPAIAAYIVAIGVVLLTLFAVIAPLWFGGLQATDRPPTIVK